MEERVQRLLLRLQEVERLLGLPEAVSDQKSYRQLTQEHAQLAELVRLPMSSNAFAGSPRTPRSPRSGNGSRAASDGERRTGSARGK